MKSAHVRRRTAGILLSTVLFALVLTVYVQVRDFSFINYDDSLFTTENRHVQSGLTLESVKWAFTDSTAYSNYWIPVTWLSFLVDSEFHGMNPGGCHLVNLVFHAANTLLLFWALHLITGARCRSFMVAAIFGLHPVHVESVAWVTERKDVLCGLFWMLSLTAYYYYVKRPNVSRYLLVLACFLLGAMSKPMIITLPFVLLLLDFWPLGRLKKINKAAGLVLEKAPFFLIIIFISAAAYLSQQQGEAVATLEQYPLMVRLENVALAYVKYLGMMLLPINHSVLYPHPGDLPLWKGGASLVFLIAAAAGAGLVVKKAPYALVGWLWYLGVLFPVSGIVVIGPHAVADRYLYLPMIGVSISAVWGGWAMLEKIDKGRIYGASLIVILVGAMTFYSYRQTGFWKDNETLYAQAIENTGENPIIHNNLGLALYEKGEYDKSIHHLELAVKMRPGYAKAHNNLGNALLTKGMTAQAIGNYELALRTDPGQAEFYSNLGAALASSGAKRRAAEYFLKSLSIDPHQPKVHFNLAVALSENGLHSQAVEHFEQSLKYGLNIPGLHFHMANSLAYLGNFERAVFHYQEVIRAEPGNHRAYKNIGVILFNMGKIDDAVGFFEKAVKLNPLDAQARAYLEHAEKKRRAQKSPAA